MYILNDHVGYGAAMFSLRRKFSARSAWNSARRGMDGQTIGAKGSFSSATRAGLNTKLKA